jgi:long-subunit fatty acid transport protein
LNDWLVEDMNVPVDYKNTLKGSLGLHYRYSDVVQLMAGYTADQSPANRGTLNPAFFDSGLKHTISGGLGLVWERIIIDLVTGYTAYPESKETGNTDIDGNNIVDNMAGTYGGSSVETVLQFTVRF